MWPGMIFNMRNLVVASMFGGKWRIKWAEKLPILQIINTTYLIII